MESLGRYSALAGRVGYFSIANDEIELVANPSDANLTATVTPNDLTLDFRLSGRDAYRQGQQASHRNEATWVATTAMRWLWGLQVQHLNPHDYGLELTPIPWIIAHDGRPLDADSLPLGQDPGWLKEEVSPVAWTAPDVTPNNPLTPILQPRVSEAHNDVEWIVLQAAVDANDADSDGVVTFAWDDEEGMKHAAELLCTNNIDNINALRALSQPEQWNAYRKQENVRSEITRIYNSIAERDQRTPDSLGAQVADRCWGPSRLRRRHGYPPAPRGISLIPPNPADAPYAPQPQGRRIAAEWDNTGYPCVESHDTHTMTELAAACRDVDPQLTLMRARGPYAGYRPSTRVYLTRTPRLLAELFKLLDPHLLVDSRVERAAEGNFDRAEVEMWVNDAWERVP